MGRLAPEGQKLGKGEEPPNKRGGKKRCVSENSERVWESTGNDLGNAQVVLTLLSWRIKGRGTGTQI